MSRFTNYLQEAIDGPDHSINYTKGNVPVGKKTVLTHTPQDTNSEEDENSIESFISKHGIRIDSESVETIIALTTKTLEDWNRDKNIDGNDIASVIFNGIKDGLIQIR